MGRASTQELRSFYRHAWLYEKGKKNPELSESDLKNAYTEYARDNGIYDKNYAEMMNLTVDKVFDSQIKWDELRNRYENGANQNNDWDRQRDTISSLFESLHNEAYDRARSGEWSTVTDQYLTDYERDEIALAEQQAYEDSMDF